MTPLLFIQYLPKADEQKEIHRIFTLDICFSSPIKFEQIGLLIDGLHQSIL
jgi:hypothetical protein